MPRRGFVPKREVLDDPMYGGKVVTKLINQVMLDGKRGTAQKACYGAFEIIREKTGREPIEVFEQAMNNIMPVVEVKARRVGGATYQVPIEIRPERRQTLGLRWLVNYSRSRGERTMMERLAGEIMDAANSTGSAFKKKEDTHKMAEANRGNRLNQIVIFGAACIFAPLLQCKLEGKEAWICQERPLWNIPGTSASWRISMPEKQQRQNGSCFLQVRSIK